MPDWAERAGRAKVAELWQEGASMTQIAEQLGAPSRSAVAGYIRREGLDRDPTKPRRPVEAAKPSRPQAPPQPRMAAVPKVRRKQQRGPLTIFELSNLSCRYPLGPTHEPATLFCGETVEKGAPYCTKHCAICFTSVVVSRRAA